MKGYNKEQKFAGDKKQRKKWWLSTWKEEKTERLQTAMPVKSNPICTLEPPKSLGMVKRRICHIHKKTSNKKI